MAQRAEVLFDARDAAGPELRGWGRYARELLDALRARGEVELRAVAGGGRGPEALFEQLGLPRIARRRGSALIHAPNCFLPLWRPCPGVVTVHDLAFEVYPEDFSRRTGAKYRTFVPRAVRSAELVITDSLSTRDDICNRYGADPARIRVIGLAPSLALGELEPPPGPYLLAVGDLRRKKNLLRLVAAFRELRCEGLPHRLVLCGLDLGAGEQVRAAAGGAPVELRGYVSDAELDALMRGAAALAYPSLYEGFGLAVVEAMARGTPVIAARSTSLPEAGGDAAEYFDPLDTGDMAAALGRVLGDADLRTAMAARGRVRAAALSWDATARATAAVYRELL